LWRGFGLITQTQADASLDAATESALHDELSAIMTTTLSKITRATCDPTKELCQYKLGDIFHSDPLVFGQPSNAAYLRLDLGRHHNSATPQCTAGGETNGGNDMPDFDRSYTCFQRRLENRRQVVYVGSNDGMVHAFNASEFQQAKGIYDGGTGNELFAYVPRGAMPDIKQNAEGTIQHWAVDGPTNSADVFIDPVDDGDTGSADGYPNPHERRWRTVLVGGFREGGPGYYALDVTQPDILTKTTGATGLR